MLVEGLALDVLHGSSHRWPSCKTHCFFTSHPVFAHHSRYLHGFQNQPLSCSAAFCLQHALGV